VLRGASRSPNCHGTGGLPGAPGTPSYTLAVNELVSVSCTGVELFVEGRVLRLEGLAPGSDYEIAGVAFSTQPDLGELRCVFATANDVHFGETICGHVAGADERDAFRVPDGATPYPEVMNAAVVADIAACDPAAVVVKGDLTDDGVDVDYARFLEVWGDVFAERLVHVRGNHDCFRGQRFAAWPTQVRELDGVTLAVLDTSREHQVGGSVADEQLEWLDELAARARQPVVVLGHHPVWDPGRDQRTDGSQWISPEDSARLVDVVARHPSITCYLAGHTHRNRCHRIGGVPFVEVACVKDFPGGWAEYRVHERGIVQVFHRAAAPAAIAWAETTRSMFSGYYGPYAMGALEDRAFVIAVPR
jgi:3',5'-cyclic-AMP phosphodiesterase